MTSDQWNESHPVGTRVRYWPVLNDDGSFARAFPPTETITRSEAWDLGSGHPVVLIKGRTGGFHLGHLEVLP
jgi:hypothetical protein